ncbi:MAG: nuclear transport factor 2 family protein [Nostocoides sp.]
MDTSSSTGLELEQTRWSALIANDLDLLDSLFSNDLVYIHSNGMVDTKDSYLAALRAGAFRYLHVTTPDAVARTFGSTIVVTGRATALTESAAGQMEVRLHFTAVWAQTGDARQFVSWHSCAATD